MVCSQAKLLTSTQFKEENNLRKKTIYFSANYTMKEKDCK